MGPLYPETKFTKTVTPSAVRPLLSRLQRACVAALLRMSPQGPINTMAMSEAQFRGCGLADRNPGGSCKGSAAAPPLSGLDRVKAQTRLRPARLVPVWVWLQNRRDSGRPFPDVADSTPTPVLRTCMRCVAERVSGLVSSNFDWAPKSAVGPNTCD
jgi:hypothetical protein